MKKLQGFLALSLAFAMVFGMTVFAAGGSNSPGASDFTDEAIASGSSSVDGSIEIVDATKEYNDSELKTIKSEALQEIKSNGSKKSPAVPEGRKVDEKAEPKVMFTMVFKDKGATLNADGTVDIEFIPPSGVFDFTKNVYQAVHLVDDGTKEILNVIQSNMGVKVVGSHGFSPFTFILKPLETVGENPTEQPTQQQPTQQQPTQQQPTQQQSTEQQPTEQQPVAATPVSPQTGETMPAAVVIALLALACAAVVGTKKVIAER